MAEFAILPTVVQDAALTLWDYAHVGDVLQKSSLIFVCCSNDPRVAEHAADLFLAGWAPLLAFSGGVGRMTEGLYGGLSEARFFANIAIQRGVPAASIVIEERSTNSGENIDFTRALLVDRGYHVESVLLVQKPYMEKRAWATFKRRWPGCPVRVSSPAIGLREYAAPPSLPLALVLNALAGDVQRCRLYGGPPRDFQVAVDVPEEAWGALAVLARHGFDEQLVRCADGSIEGLVL